MKLALCALGAVVLATGAASAEEPYWVEPMKQVHASFTGTAGSIAQFGDSITYSQAFFTPLQYAHANVPPQAQTALTWLNGYIQPACWGWKGWYYGNYGGTIIDQAVGAANGGYDYAPGGVTGDIDLWLQRLNPEMAVIMWGTNDACCEICCDGGAGRPIFAADLTTDVQKCKANGTIPILTTIPPMHIECQQWQWEGPNPPNSDWRVFFTEWLVAVQNVAQNEQVPLIGYYEEIVARRPNDPGDERDGDWNGTLMVQDDRHPSNTAPVRDFSETMLSTNGYTLRNYVTLLKMHEVYEEVIVPTPGAVGLLVAGALAVIARRRRGR